MSAIREFRLRLKLSQSALAARLGTSVETFRTWDSGRRAAPPSILAKVRELADREPGERLLSLPELARVLGVHERTLRMAARDGRLAVSYDTRVFYGKPTARATRAAGEEFKRRYYRRMTRWTERPSSPAPLPTVPDDYRARLVALRARLGLTQAQLAVRLGAASKAVVYQWESQKRRPSPLFWLRVEYLEAASEHNSPQTDRPAATPGLEHVLGGILKLTRTARFPPRGRA